MTSTQSARQQLIGERHKLIFQNLRGDRNSMQAVLPLLAQINDTVISGRQPLLAFELHAVHHRAPHF